MGVAQPVALCQTQCLIHSRKQIHANNALPVHFRCRQMMQIVHIPLLLVLRGHMQVERHVKHVVLVNIRQPPEEPIVIFAVLANIRQTPEEQPIAIKVALPARTLVILPTQPNTMNKMIVPFVVLENIPQPI